MHQRPGQCNGCFEPCQVSGFCQHSILNGKPSHTGGGYLLFCRDVRLYKRNLSVPLKPQDIMPRLMIGMMPSIAYIQIQRHMHASCKWLPPGSQHTVFILSRVAQYVLSLLVQDWSVSIRVLFGIDVNAASRGWSNPQMYVAHFFLACPRDSPTDRNAQSLGMFAYRHRGRFMADVRCRYVRLHPHDDCLLKDDLVTVAG